MENLHILVVARGGPWVLVRVSGSILAPAAGRAMLFPHHLPAAETVAGEVACFTPTGPLQPPTLRPIDWPQSWSRWCCRPAAHPRPPIQAWAWGSALQSSAFPWSVSFPKSSTISVHRTQGNFWVLSLLQGAKGGFGGDLPLPMSHHQFYPDVAVPHKPGWHVASQSPPGVQMRIKKPGKSLLSIGLTWTTRHTFHHVCPLPLPLPQTPRVEGAGFPLLLVWTPRIPPSFLQEGPHCSLLPGYSGRLAVWDSSLWGKELYVGLIFSNYYSCYKWYKKITAFAAWKLKGLRMEAETVRSWIIVLHGRC